MDVHGYTAIFVMRVNPVAYIVLTKSCTFTVLRLRLAISVTISKAGESARLRITF